MNRFNEESAVDLDDDNDFMINTTDTYDESESEVDKDIDSEEDGEKDVEYKTYLDLTVEDVYGMSFATENDAYKFYYAYAKSHGFGIRKDEIERGANHNIVMRQFLCNKAGLRDKKHLMRDDRKKDHRPLTRTNCKAKLRLRVNPSTSRWEVVSFVESHNHQLCPSNFVPLIRTYRGLCDADKVQVDCLHAQGVRTCHIMGYMMDQKGGLAGLNFSKKDLFNHIEQHKRSLIKDGDVFAALSYLQGKADNDPMFFSRYTLTDDGKLNHLFWADGTSRSDFQCFGDVVAFDSTYKKNKYNQPLVIFSGKNHHAQTVIFGCAVVSDESTDTYKWLLESFLYAMSNKHPKAIVTDGDSAMREAIKHVFPDASHRLCAWHLQKNAQQNVKNSSFLQDFGRAMYGNFLPDKFEHFWKELVVKHKLQENNWVTQTYEKRFMWATAYLRDKFFAGIRTTSLCEGINSRIKSYIRKKNTIVELLHNLEHSLRDYRYNELISDFNSFYTEPVLTTSLSNIEIQASQIYTRNIFNLVKSEILTAGGLNVIERNENRDMVIFKVDKFCERHSEHDVIYDKHDSKFECDCMKFESSGIPCSHIICVMRLEHMQSLPASLICKRWLKDAKSSFISCYEAKDKDNDMMTMARFGVLAASSNRLCQIASKNINSFNFVRSEILKLTNKLQEKENVHMKNGTTNEVGDPNVVKTKGAPQKKNHKKMSKKFSNCKATGHLVTSCPVLHAMDDFCVNDDSCGMQDNGEKSMSIDESNGQNMIHRQLYIKDDMNSEKEVSCHATQKDKKQRCFNLNLRKDNSKLKGKVSSYNQPNDVNLNCSIQKMKNVVGKKSTTHCSAEQGNHQMTDMLPLQRHDALTNSSSSPVMSSSPRQNNHQRINMLPPQQNVELTSFASTQRTPLPPLYGLVPYYSQYPQVPVFPLPNSMPMITDYGAMGNLNGGRSWNDLLQHVIKRGSETGEKSG